MGAKVLAAALAVSGCVFAAAPAQADQAILGVPTPTDVGGGFGCGGDSCTFVQFALPAGNVVTPPGNGRIVAWWALARNGTAGETVTARLRLTHVSPTTHKTAGVGTSSPQTLGTTVVNFPTDLPTRAGDHIGITAMTPNGAFVDVAPDNGATIQLFSGPLPDGTSASPNTSFANNVLQLGAQFFYQPVVTSIAAGSGPATGGDSVVITGSHLTDTTAVRFGSAPASTFHIDSNTQITATAPTAPAGTVDVSVTGPGGTSATTSSDKYTFIGPTGTVNPDAIDFGTSPLQVTSVERFVTMSNTGTVPAHPASASLDGPDAGDYAKTFDSCSGKVIAPGHSCEVDVTFTPTAVGLRRATLELTDDLPGSPQDVALTGSGANGADKTPPVLSGASLAHTTFAVAKSKPPKGTTIRFQLSEPAVVVFTVTRRLPGRREGKRCVTPTKKLRHAKRCTRTVTLGNFTRTAGAGLSKIPFNGRLGGRKLKPGSYTFTLAPTDASGNRGVQRSVGFKIVKSR